MTEQLAYSVLKESNACSDTDILSVTGGVLRVRRSVTEHSQDTCVQHMHYMVFDASPPHIHLTTHAEPVTTSA